MMIYPTVPSSHTDLLEAKAFAFTATIGPHLSPQVTPTWYLWDSTNRHLLISLTTGRQKYHNLKRDPHVAVCILDPADPYRYLDIRGVAVSVDPDSEHKFLNALTKNYLDKDAYTAHQPGDVRVIVRIQPQRILRFG
jgi:PPOX class probable F420-dependent enzyme